MVIPRERVQEEFLQGRASPVKFNTKLGGLGFQVKMIQILNLLILFVCCMLIFPVSYSVPFLGFPPYEFWSRIRTRK